MRKKLALPIILACAVGVAVNIWVAVGNARGWGQDFNQFYSASRLAGTGRLYDWEALRKIEARNGREIPTGRLPVVAFGMKIFGALPYRAAQAAWLALSLAALLVSVSIWPGANGPIMRMALAWSMPAALLLLYGQDTPLWLMFFAIGLLLLHKERPALAGVAFSLCLCKYHLAVALPVLLIAQKRWKALFAASASVVLLIAASFAIEGASWPFRYLETLTHPRFSPAPERMPNLRGVASWFPWPGAIEIAGAVAVAALLWILSRRSDLGTAGAATAACGLLLGRHGYANDCALLIPLAVLTIQQRPAPAFFRAWAILVLTFVPTLLLVTTTPYLGQVVLVGFVLGTLVGNAHSPSLREPAPRALSYISP